ncbi:MAG: hypothetical protein OK436_01625 [Thaumarchaeota archaeon]|nr:hypothetical protein [Nitrososphaerota archaeon]
MAGNPLGKGATTTANPAEPMVEDEPIVQRATQQNQPNLHYGPDQAAAYEASHGGMAPPGYVAPPPINAAGRVVGQQQAPNLAQEVGSGGRAIVSDIQMGGGMLLADIDTARSFLGTNKSLSQTLAETRGEPFLQREQAIGGVIAPAIPAIGPVAGVASKSLAEAPEAASFLERVAMNAGVSSAYSTLTSRQTNPEKIGEAALFGGALGAGGAAIGESGIGSKLANVAERFKLATGPPASTVEGEFGTYSGIPRGEQSFTSRVTGMIRKAPQTPGVQLTDVPATESTIPARQFGEVFAQKKFGIEPTPEPTYEFERRGTVTGGGTERRGFEFSPETERQQTFTRSGPSGGGGYGGAGRQFYATQEQGQVARYPPGSPFEETFRFRSAFEQSIQRGPQSDFMIGSVFPSGLKTKSPLAAKPSTSTSTLPDLANENVQLPRGIPGQATIPRQTTTPVTVTTTTPPPPPTVSTRSPPPSSEFSFPVAPRGQGVPYFLQGPSFPSEKKGGRQRFGFKEIKHPVGNILGGSLPIAKGFKQTSRRKKR